MLHLLIYNIHWAHSPKGFQSHQEVAEGPDRSWMLNWIFWKTLTQFLKRGICFKTPISVSLNLYSQRQKRNESTVSVSHTDTNQSSFDMIWYDMIWYDPHGFKDVACDTMNVAGNPVSSSTFLPHVEPQLQHVLSTWHSLCPLGRSQWWYAAASQYCLKPLAVYTSSVHLWHWPKPEISQEIKVQIPKTKSEFLGATIAEVGGTWAPTDKFTSLKDCQLGRIHLPLKQLNQTMTKHLWSSTLSRLRYRTENWRFLNIAKYHQKIPNETWLRLRLGPDFGKTHRRFATFYSKMHQPSNPLTVMTMTMINDDEDDDEKIMR